MKTSILSTLTLAVTLLSLPHVALSGDNAQFISQKLPSAMSAGVTYRVKLTFKNTGSTVWRESGGVGSQRLGSQSPANNQTWRPLNRVTLAPGEVIRPGKSKSFEFDITAPVRPGTYRFQWQMLEEGRQGFFGAKSKGMDFVVAAAPVVFNYDQSRIHSLVVHGQNLLQGTGGIYLIGSADGSDAQGRSVTSKGSINGFMVSDNTSRVPPPRFKLNFSLGSTPSTLKFYAEVGPVPIDFATLSMPFDFRRDMVQAFKFDGTRYHLECTGQDGWRNRSGANYNAIPQGCEIRNVAGQLLGRVGAAATQQATRWGEASGPFGQVRVNITRSSHYRSLIFYNHFGTKNLELSFGRMRRGETAFVEGEIVVTPSR